MIAKFYNCIRDERYVQKVKVSDQQGTDVNVEILTDNNNVVRPTIRISSGILNQSVNYVWLKDFKRFYYIRNWTADNGYITLDLEVDVLMSFKRELMNSPAMVARNEKSSNKYITDDNIKMLAPTATKVLKDGWTSPFSKTTSYFYLAVVSSQGADNNE